MGYEVDFLPVGDGSRSGDAIALRYGNLHGRRSEQTVIVLDGGFADDGKALVEHITEFYGTDHVDYVVSTHLDCDHINGLTVVLEELSVGELWVHQPKADEMSFAIEAALSRSVGRKQRLAEVRASIQGARSLAELARSKGIPVVEPFTGVTTADGAFSVMGPTEEYYDELVSQFRTYQPRQSLREAMALALEKKGMTWETMEHETLDEESETSPENNSSAITLLQVDGRSSVFTGDAGAEALHLAADHLDSQGFGWSSLRFMQIPHHGSQRNVTPSVLDRFLGPKPQRTPMKTAFVSCSPDGAPKHPAKKVTNAFIRRGCNVHATQGVAKRHHHDAPPRDGFSRAEPLPFYDVVEE